MSRLADHLAARLADQAAPPVLAPGVFDGLSARMASMAGAEALYLSGASLAYTRFGSPDIGLVSMSELGDTVAAITEKTETPLIVDADTGFGNALNVQRTCRNLARAGAAAHGVDELEALEAIAGLGLLADDVEDRVDELGALGVVALGPVVARARLAEDEVVRAEELAEGARADRVHGAGLEVHEDGARHVAAARRLVVVHVDALELEVRVAVVRARRVDAVLVGDDLPELGADLVAALAALDVQELAGKPM